MLYSNRCKSILVIAGITVVVVAGALLILTKNSATEKEIKKPPQTTTMLIPELKLYRNEEWGFEFEYPEGWFFHEDTFYSPFSKFNLAGAPSGVEYQLVIPFLINIVTPDFANKVVMSSRNSGDIETDFVVDKLQGKKFESMVPAPNITIDLPFGEFRMILATYKEYEDIFNHILASFKFLK